MVPLSVPRRCPTPLRHAYGTRRRPIPFERGAWIVLPMVPRKCQGLLRAGGRRRLGSAGVWRLRRVDRSRSARTQVGREPAPNTSPESHNGGTCCLSKRARAPRRRRNARICAIVSSKCRSSSDEKATRCRTPPAQTTIPYGGRTPYSCCTRKHSAATCSTCDRSTCDGCSRRAVRLCSTGITVPRTRTS
jgi:hypothetical protein